MLFRSPSVACRAPDPPLLAGAGEPPPSVACRAADPPLLAGVGEPPPSVACRAPDPPLLFGAGEPPPSVACRAPDPPLLAGAGEPPPSVACRAPDPPLLAGAGEPHRIIQFVTPAAFAATVETAPKKRSVVLGRTLRTKKEERYITLPSPTRKKGWTISLISLGSM